MSSPRPMIDRDPPDRKRPPNGHIVQRLRWWTFIHAVLEPIITRASERSFYYYPAPVKFVDSCDVDVVAGKGGNGAIAFRREKFVPFGGPSGGDGGRGGDVVFVADEGLSTLLDLTYGRVLRAGNGEQGHGKDMYGRGAEDLIVRVPVGTQVKDRETGELLFDLDRGDSRHVVARGGKGGRGNIHFATPYDRAPRRAEPGEAGEERRLRLELKVMADVGLLGFPNVGKSPFIRAVSNARPKGADNPFTTLTPHLGVVRIGDEATMVIADIPGLIPGASEGAGLGHRFLKHVERTRALLHLVTLDFGEERDPLADYTALVTELERFDPELAKRPQLVAMTKADLPEVREAYPAVRERFAKRKISLHLVSAATGEGVRELSVALYKLVTGKREIEDWETAPSPPRSSPPPSSPALNGAALESWETTPTPSQPDLSAGPYDQSWEAASADPPESDVRPLSEPRSSRKDATEGDARPMDRAAPLARMTTPKKTPKKASKADAKKASTKKTSTKKAPTKTAGGKKAAKKTSADGRKAGKTSKASSRKTSSTSTKTSSSTRPAKSSKKPTVGKKAAKKTSKK